MCILEKPVRFEHALCYQSLQIHQMQYGGGGAGPGGQQKVVGIQLQQMIVMNQPGGQGPPQRQQMMGANSGGQMQGVQLQRVLQQQHRPVQQAQQGIQQQHLQPALGGHMVCLPDLLPFLYRRNTRELTRVVLYLLNPS